MSNNKLLLDCTLGECKVMLGPGKKGTNKIVVQLKNTGNDDIQFQGRGAQGTFSLAYSVGNQAPDFVADDQQSRDVKVEPEAKWEELEYTNLSGRVTRPFRLPPLVLNGQAQTTLPITNFQCESDPGQLKLTVRVEVTGYDSFEKSFDIEKQATGELQILYFRANPPQILTPQDREKFVLEWNTVNAATVKLYKADQLVDTLKARTRGFENGKLFSCGDQKPSLSVVYKLEAVDAAESDTRPAKKISVAVLEKGFRRLDDFRNRFGYPAVLCNADGVKLYGVFVKHGKACLCSSEYPVVLWEVEKSVVPDKMETSPTAYLGNQLWLVGGSAADTKNISNQVWFYAPSSGAWSQQAGVPWKPRMGHVCVVGKGRVWILGGLDANGNALREVWSCGTGGDWKRHADAAWPARCMPAATDFNGKLWVYGGVTEPFGDPLEDIWTSSDGENWQPYTSTPKFEGRPAGKPLGCALQELNKKLNLFGTFRDGTITEAKRFVLDEGQQSWNGTSVAENVGWDRQEGNTFSLMSAQYKGLVFLRSLSYQVADNPTDLNLFVP